ncbi:homocysteine S-methyltransferase YbgG [Aplysia californica]|uniref:Homocysteine S-methyltransferase YbgG n=1 Tax=Aplysia californica TaxID=6500 RepID=A0ABM1A3N5_APLCA|nr:homocysteine S-methyltransferase YbgG [Aplysia californica]
MAQKQKVVVLDGGTGMTLQEMGHVFPQGDLLWSARIVKSHPGDLIKLHKQFYSSGADIVVTATYQASLDGYRKVFNLDEEAARDCLKLGVTLAQTARDEIEKDTGRRLYVAASIGAYGAVQTDWSEYNGRYVDTMSKQELSDWHLPRMKAILETNPDLLAFETIPAVKEAEAVLDNLQHFPDVKAWLTFQCKDGFTTGHGESIVDAVRLVARYKNVVATGINCVHPKFVTSLLQQIATAKLDIPIIVKPNAGFFEHDESTSGVWKLSDQVDEWLRLGATWLGGCCHIYSSDIAEMRRALEQRADVSLLATADRLV